MILPDLIIAVSVPVCGCTLRSHGDTKSSLCLYLLIRLLSELWVSAAFSLMQQTNEISWEVRVRWCTGGTRGPASTPCTPRCTPVWGGSATTPPWLRTASVRWAARQMSHLRRSLSGGMFCLNSPLDTKNPLEGSRGLLCGPWSVLAVLSPALMC